MKIAFMGTPQFSVPALNAIRAAGHDIVAVYTQPPRPAGRGKKDRATPVHMAAEALELGVMFPKTLRSSEVQKAFAALDLDIAVVVAYGLILPQAVLDAPKRGCLNIHASLLPRWRGAAPIHRAVMAGDAQTGVAIMQMEAGLDTGPVLLERRTDIGPEETTGDLHGRLADLGASAIVDALDNLDTLNAVPQPATGVSYADKIDKAEARIDWSRSSVDIDRLIRGLSPFPGAWTSAGGERIKLLRSRVAEGDGPPGKVLDGFRIACGSGAVEIIEAQRSGKAPMASDDLLKGYQLPNHLD